MRSEAVFSAMSFAIAGLQVSCGIEGQALRIKVTPADSLKPSQLAITKMTADPLAIEFSIAHIPHTHNATSTSFPSQISVEGHQSSKGKLEEKLANLESTVKLLEERIISRSQSRRQLKKSSSSQVRFGTSASKSNLGALPSVAIRENQETQYTEIIQEEVQQNAKLQLLNDLLQEKILQKETACLQVERRLMQREQLIRELADKLIIANIEKEDIFNEYEKILQNNVFHRMEESPTKQYDQPTPSQRETIGSEPLISQEGLALPQKQEQQTLIEVKSSGVAKDEEKGNSG